MADSNEHKSAAESRSGWVEALQEELRGYKQQGKTDRAKQVQDQLDKVLGGGKPKVTRGRSKSE